MLRDARLFAPAICALVFSSDSAVGQRPCEACELRVSRVAVLGNEDGPGSLGGAGTVVRHEDGSYYVVTSRMSDQVMVFGPEGEYLRSIGQRGSGPGEFLHIWRIELREDQLHVFDADNARRTVIRVPSGTLLAEHRMTWPAISVAVLPQDLVINANMRTSELAGIPLHRVSAQGEIVRSFGGSEDVFRTDIAYSGHRVIAASGANAVWASPRTEYVLTLWSLEGDRLNTVRRSPDWFKPHTRSVDFKPDHAPPPLVTHVHEDANGNLWVLVAVADRNWRQALTLRRDHPDGPTYVPRDFDSYFDSIIEVIDPATGRVLASARVDRYLTGFADATHLVGFTETTTGVPQAEVWRVEFTPPKQE